MFDRDEISKIPGMIEPVEQKLLYDMASQLTLQKSDQFVEFGTFFGRSTACLAQGLADNKSRTAKNKLHAYDSFSCATNGGFVEHVRSFSNEGGVGHLLNIGDKIVDFYPVFEYYLSNFIDSGVVKPSKCGLELSIPNQIDSIALMHIDSPKFYEELKIILFRFFPLLKDGAIVIFQDFFYHWSATLIAAVEGMRKIGLIEYKMSAASSLIVQVNGPVSIQNLVELDLLMLDSNVVDGLLSDAIRACNHISLDRSDIFLSRIWLASFQHLWSVGEFEKATDLIKQFLMSGKLSTPVAEDFLEMMRQGFSTRSGYKRDRVESKIPCKY